MEKKIKVAHVIRVFSYGGAEILLRECFANTYFKENITSELYILDHKKLELIDTVKANINSVHYYKISSSKFIIEYAKFLRSIIKGKYDIVHIHLPAAGWMTIAARLFTRKTKYIYSEHNLVTFYSKRNYYLLGLIYNFFDCVIYVSYEAENVIKNVRRKFFFKAKKTITILNGIDTDKFLNTERPIKNLYENFTVGLVARFRKQKRVDRWADVAKEINKYNTRIKFLMVGDGPDDNMLREKIKQLNLANKIELTGKSVNVTEAFKRIDIFLLTSEFEGLPLALLEAMSMGCVPVVSNVGGIKQLDFKNFGYKFSEFNAEAIAAIITAYANNPEKLKVESLNARAFVEKNHSLAKQVYEFVHLYRQMKNEV